MSETAIKITLSSKKNRTDNNGLIWRTWKVLIQSVHNNFFLENYIDHVEYLLHPSFEDPRIVCTQEPYMIRQEGWGEFDLRITFYFRNESLPPQTIVFDVNFSRSRYSVYQTLNVNLSSLILHTKKRPKHDFYSSASSSPITTPMNECTMFNSPYLALHHEEDLHQWLLYDPKTYCRSSQEEKFTRATKSNFGNVPENVNLSELAMYLESMDDDDLREIYHIILRYDTKDMVIVETNDNVLLDLCTLGTCLLNELWLYTIKMTRQRRRLLM